MKLLPPKRREAKKSLDLEELDMPPKVIDVLKKANILHLNPPQSASVEAGLLNLSSSFVIASPTASGKTLIAELLMVKAILEKRVKALYVVPLRALANEKYESFKARWSSLGVRVAISTGDFDSADQWLGDYDIIVMTSEKADSLLRHRASWISNVGVAVIDEVHTLTDAGRGPTLEITITRLRRMNPKMLFLFLSATIRNANELAAWIGGKLIESEWRPVKLYEGVFDGEKIQFVDKPAVKITVDGSSEVKLASSTVSMGKQALVFAATRRSAEAVAERCAEVTRKFLKAEEAKELARVADGVEHALESSTPQCRRLAAAVRKGSAFHHAGLAGKQRLMIEKAFRDRLLKIIASTPTLAYGVDLPAFRCIIRDARRYYAGLGYKYIPVLEYEQMRGRAGRPSYDEFGESILVAHSEDEAEQLRRIFVDGEAEEITSKLNSESALRTHVLAIIATEAVKTMGDLEQFFSQTFFGHREGAQELREIVLAIVEQLTRWGFVADDKLLNATRLGRRVSELYIDPATAAAIMVALNKHKPTHFGLLHLISSTDELAPRLRVSAKEFDDITDILGKRENELMVKAPEDGDPDFEEFLNAVKTAATLAAWCDEATDATLYSKFRAAPGEFYNKKEIADWLLYSAGQLANLLGKREETKAVMKTRIRLMYGVREELLPLVRLKGIGRARARALFEAGYKSLQQLKEADIGSIAAIAGPKIAAEIKEQLTLHEKGQARLKF